MSANSPSSPGAPRARTPPARTHRRSPCPRRRTRRLRGAKLGRPGPGRRGQPAAQFRQRQRAHRRRSLTAALDGLMAGTGSEQQVHAALAEARVYIAVVAQLAEGGLGGARVHRGQGSRHGPGDAHRTGRTHRPAGLQQRRRPADVAPRGPPRGRLRPACSTLGGRRGSPDAGPGPGCRLHLRAAPPRHVGPGPATGHGPPATSTRNLRRSWPNRPLDRGGRWPPIAHCPGPGSGHAGPAGGASVPGGGPGPELRLEFTFRAGHRRSCGPRMRRRDPRRACRPTRTLPKTSTRSRWP